MDSNASIYDSTIPVDQGGLTIDEQTAGMQLPKGARFQAGNHKLDTDEEVQRHYRMVNGWWNYERARQYESRADRMQAHDFIDGDQWTEEEKTELETRGQMAYVFNLMKATHDWLSGTERRMRYDFNVLPRRKEAGASAENKTKLLKYINDINNARYNRSLSFKDKIISGLGWRDVGIRSNAEEDPLYVRYEDWRNVWHDSCAKQWDLSDARYQFRTRIVDYDVAVAMWPDRWSAIKAAVNQHGDILTDEYDETNINPELAELAGEDQSLYGMGVKRDRIRLISCEYRLPSNVKIIRGDIGSLNGAIFDDSNEGMSVLVNGGHASLVDAVRMVIYKMVFTGKYVLQWGRRPYHHNRFSLVPDWCYRRKKDGMPYGVAKQQIHPQIDLNKRAAKALWHLSSNQVIVEEDNWTDRDEFDEEKDRPDGTIVVKDVSKVQFRDSAKQAVTVEHVSLMERDARFIESVGGVNDESRGVETNAASGKAIQKRQESTNINTTEVFDNSLHAFKLEGEIQLSLAEQYYTEERTIRITGQDGKPEYVGLNQVQPDGRIINDITETQCDFVIEAQTYAATVRQSMFEQLGAMLGSVPPEISLLLLDMWIDLSDLPGREAMVQRIRKVSGMTDPNEDPEDPQVQARKQAESEEAQKQKAIADALMQLEVQLKAAQVEKEKGTAAESLASARATLAGINQKYEELRIKKAQALNTIEARREQALLPASTPKKKSP